MVDSRFVRVDSCFGGVGRVALFALACGLSPVPVAADETFVVDVLAPGVRLFHTAGPSARRSNSLVVERDDGLLVVGAQPDGAAARELLAALGAAAAPRYLVLPHSHADAAGGAAAFPASTLVIGTAGCRGALEDPAYDFGAELRVRAPDPQAWAEPPRRLPTLVLEARTVLADPRNPVELLPFGGAHSVGDMLVRLPSQQLTFAGSVLAPDRAPYAGDAAVLSWISGLNQLVHDGDRVLIPLHGPPLDVAAVRVQRDAFAWLSGAVEAALSDQVPLDAIRDRVLANDGLAQRFVVDSPYLGEFIERTARQAAEVRRKYHRP